MSNEPCLIKLENISKKTTYIYSNSIYVFENKTSTEKWIDFKYNWNIPLIIIDLLNNDNQGDMFEKFNNYLKYGLKEY
ncbi:Uncharacterised protein [Clostridium perfringens]|uniref:Uncharacterized protein n=1 Tax=Clostridium perfringens TaxID=1502 RepID=A0A2X3E8D6_CLOPF|nr:Uncharacterised protein [Clostridium perfringens]